MSQGKQIVHMINEKVITVIEKSSSGSYVRFRKMGLGGIIESHQNTTSGENMEIGNETFLS